MNRSVEITKKEFDHFLNQFDAIPFIPEGTSEIVYRIPLPHDLSLWVYSTISQKTKKSRKHGLDAIRTIMIFKNEFGVMREKKTLRTYNWRNNLKNRIKKLITRVTNFQCPKGHPLVLRKSHTTKNRFYGCVMYPYCKFTRKR